jgi:4-coumarate--CoA ligase
MSEDFGKGLKAIFGWRKGDVLGVFSPNHIDIPPVTLGTLWAGGTLSPANPGYTANELAQQLLDSGTRVIATQLSVLDIVKESCRAVGIGDDCIILLGDRDTTGRYKHWTSIRNTSGSIRYVQSKVKPKIDTAFLIYSSGTTGKPKGVRLSHYNLVSNVLQVQASEQYNLTWDGSKTSSDIPAPAPQSGGDKVLASLPLFHIYGLTMFVLCPLYTGVTTFIMSRFDLEKWCTLVQRHRITYAYIVPPIVQLLSKSPIVSKFDLSSIRMTNSGAAPLSRELVEVVYKRTGVRVKQGYGLSETSPRCFHQRWDDWLSGAGSVGWLLPNMEAKLCVSLPEEVTSGEPQELNPGEMGELYLRGPNVFAGYHNRPEVTAECLSGGWFRTGDVGYIDTGGNLFITDRLKELIKYKGFQVAPADLEGTLLGHPDVADCAVVGVFSSVLGTEVPRAYVVPRPEASITAGEVSKWLDQRVSSHKKLRGGVKFVEGIPKSASGKILRRGLKEQARAEFALKDLGKVKASL